MAGRIIWSPRAANQLENICEYIAVDSPAYAKVFAQKVIAIVKSIPSFPEVGRIVPEYENKTLREKIYNNYRIVYRVHANRIEIAAICHCAQLISNAMSHLD